MLLNCHYCRVTKLPLLPCYQIAITAVLPNCHYCRVTKFCCRICSWFFVSEISDSGRDWTRKTLYSRNHTRILPRPYHTQFIRNVQWETLKSRQLTRRPQMCSSNCWTFQILQTRGPSYELNNTNPSATTDNGNPSSAVLVPEDHIPDSGLCYEKPVLDQSSGQPWSWHRAEQRLKLGPELQRGSWVVCAELPRCLSVRDGKKSSFFNIYLRSDCNTSIGGGENACWRASDCRHGVGLPAMCGP